MPDEPVPNGGAGGSGARTSLARISAMARKDMWLYLGDPAPIVILAALPLVLMEFLRPSFRLALTAEGFGDATGAEQAVPGMAVLYSFLFVANVGMSFFRELGWGTWGRLQASHLRPHEVVLGKAVAPFGVAFGLLSVLFLIGVVVFRVRISGNPVALLPLGVALSSCVVSLGVTLMCWSRTMMQFGAFANLSSLVLAGVGGAVTPFSLLPGWAQRLGPVSPCYWAMQGFRDVILEGEGFGGVARPTLVMLAEAAALTALATLGMRRLPEGQVLR